jgi:YHS domain-containing protein
MTIRLRNNFVFALGLSSALSLSSVLGLSSPAWAQSSTKAPARTSRTVVQGSDTAEHQATVALSGYCPVCVIEMRKWVKGDSRFAVVQDGKTYLFPSDEQKQMFVKNPDKYTPALGGKCTVCLVEIGKTMDGSVGFATMHEGRLFLFPSDEQKQMFLKNAAKYANVDLAAQGQCTVCRVEMQKQVQGRPEFAAIHKDMRYWFPSEDQLKMFVSNPAKYEVK